MGSRLDLIIAWLDANCGADGWTSTPSSFAFGETARSASTRGVVNNAPAIYFADMTIASAFVARWCAAQRVEVVDGGGVRVVIRSEPPDMLAIRNDADRSPQSR